MSREDYAKLFGITEILGFAFGGKKFTMADFGLLYLCTGRCLGLHMVCISENHRSNALNLSKNNDGIDEPEISHALKYNRSPNMRHDLTMNIASLHKV